MPKHKSLAGIYLALGVIIILLLYSFFASQLESLILKKLNISIDYQKGLRCGVLITAIIYTFFWSLQTGFLDHPLIILGSSFIGVIISSILSVMLVVIADKISGGSIDFEFGFSSFINNFAGSLVGCIMGVGAYDIATIDHITEARREDTRSSTSKSFIWLGFSIVIVAGIILAKEIVSGQKFLDALIVFVDKVWLAALAIILVSIFLGLAESRKKLNLWSSIFGSTTALAFIINIFGGYVYYEKYLIINSLLLVIPFFIGCIVTSFLAGIRMKSYDEEKRD